VPELGICKARTCGIFAVPGAKTANQRQVACKIDMTSGFISLGMAQKKAL